MSRKTYRKKNQPSSRQLPWPWLAVVGALLIIGGGLMIWSPFGAASTAGPEVAGGPRLAVDQTVVDEGYIKLDNRVRTTFRLKNVGDQPLHIIGQPQVELVEGC